jgi:hypothetical protein
VRRRALIVWSALCFKPTFPLEEAKVERKYVYKQNFVIIISVYARLRVAPFKCFNQFTDFRETWYEHSYCRTWTPYWLLTQPPCYKESRYMRTPFYSYVCVYLIKISYNLTNFHETRYKYYVVLGCFPTPQFLICYNYAAKTEWWTCELVGASNTSTTKFWILKSCMVIYEGGLKSFVSS